MPHFPRMTHVYAGVVACVTAFCVAPVMAQSVPLLPGEAVMVEVFGRPELSGERVIDERGEIALPLAGRIPATGADPATLATRIGEALTSRGLERTPDVSVTATRRLDVYLDGAVARPGAYPWRPGLTLEQALALAGGRVLIGADEMSPAIQALRSVEYARGLDQQRKTLELREARLRAEADFAHRAFGPGGEAGAAPQLSLPDRLAGDPALADLITAERRLLDQRAAAARVEHGALLDQKAALEEQIGFLERRAMTLEEETRLIRARLDTLEALQERGLAAAAQLLDIQRANSAAVGSQIQVASAIAEARVTLADRQLDLQNFAVDRERAANESLAGVLAELGDVRSRFAPAMRAGAIAATYDAGAMGASVRTDGVILLTRVGAAGPTAAGPGTALHPGDLISVPAPPSAEPDVGRGAAETAPPG